MSKELPTKELPKTTKNPKSWRPGLADLAGLAKELVQEHPRPGRPALPWPPRGKIVEPS